MTTDLHAAKRAARTRYLAQHARDPVPPVDPEAAVIVEAPVADVPRKYRRSKAPRTEREQSELERLMRNTSGCAPGEKRLQAEV